MTPARVLTFGLVAGVVTGCASRAGFDANPDRVGELGPASIDGIVRVVGSDPLSHTAVEAEDGASYPVTGALSAEIRRLTGIRVRLTGQLVHGEFPTAALDASSWEILAVDGERPVVGRLERDGDGFHLVRPEGVVQRLGFVPDALAARAGALIWAVIDEGGAVTQYGVVRDAGDAPPRGDGR